MMCGYHISKSIRTSIYFAWWNRQNVQKKRNPGGEYEEMRVQSVIFSGPSWYNFPFMWIIIDFNVKQVLVFIYYEQVNTWEVKYWNKFNIQVWVASEELLE